MKHRALRQRIGMLLVLLAGGAIVNVAVAWTACWKRDVGDWTFHSPYSNEVVLADNEFGWPARALSNDPEPKAFQQRRFSVNTGEPRLPLLPLWPGFAINMVFYAALLWMLFAVPFTLRRRRRIRRGLCPKCAYDLRGGRGNVDAAMCPECGALASNR